MATVASVILKQTFLQPLHFQNDFTYESMYQSNISDFYGASLQLYQFSFLSEHALVGSMPRYLTRHINTLNIHNFETCMMTIALISAEKWCKNKNDKHTCLPIRILNFLSLSLTRTYAASAEKFPFQAKPFS